MSNDWELGTSTPVDADFISSKILDLYTEASSILGYLATVRKLHAGAAPPLPDLNRLWFDTRAATLGLYYCSDPDGDGGAGTWLRVAATGSYGSGVGLDAGAKGRSRFCVLAEATTQIKVMGPATIEINGVVLQNTGHVYLNLIGSSAGRYYAYATRNGTGQDFVLGKASSANTAADKRDIGEFWWDGSAVRWVDSYEPVPAGVYPRGLVHMKADGSAVPSGAWTVVGHRSAAGTWAVSDVERMFLSIEDGAGKGYIKRAGWWEFNASVMFSHTEAQTWTVGVKIRKSDADGVTNAADVASFVVPVASAATARARVSCLVNLAIGERIWVEAWQVGAAAASRNTVSSANDFDTAFWGRYLGPAA